MKSYSSKEVISILKQHGFYIARYHGDDAILKKEGYQYNVKVPMCRQHVCIGTLKSIEKQSNIKFS